MGHKNLLQAIGERPETEINPKLIEKNPITIAVQINNQADQYRLRAIYQIA